MSMNDEDNAVGSELPAEGVSASVAQADHVLRKGDNGLRQSLKSLRLGFVASRAFVQLPPTWPFSSSASQGGSCLDVDPDCQLCRSTS